MLELYGEVQDAGRGDFSWEIIDDSGKESGREPSVADPRFTTVYGDLDELLNLVDIDDVGDVETLLMFVFDRRIGVDVE